MCQGPHYTGSAAQWCGWAGGTVPSLGRHNGCLFTQNKPLLQCYVSIVTVQPPEPKHTNDGHAACAGSIQCLLSLLKYEKILYSGETG